MTHRNLSGSSLSSMLRAIYPAPHERWLARLAGALSAFAPALVLANPTGGQVVAGSATIGTAGSNGVIVDQTSQRAAINWQQFSIGSNEYVQFVQPNSSSVVLNRVTGSNPSSIFGSIQANGQVFLINPNGILFAPGSTLDVSSLTASTLDISDSNFMAGRYVFSRDPGSTAATVVNQGNVTVTQGGYVILQGDYVENDGVIQAQSGKVALAAGGGATLTLDNSGGLIGFKIDAPTLARLAGVDNAGSIVANGGMVVMTADVANALTATAVNNSGLVTAHSAVSHGGVIELLSEDKGAIDNSGTLDASATQKGVAGGTIILHGKGKTELTPASVITTAGDGAQGGFIDLSGHDLAIRGRVTAGHGGSLLLDPTTINIVNGSASAGGTNVNSIGVGFIQNKLNAGSNVTLVATGSIDNAGGAARIINATNILAGGTRFRIATGTIASNCVAAQTGVCFGKSPAVGSFPGVTVGTGTITLSGLTINTKGQFLASAGQGAVTLDAVTANFGITITGGQIQVNGNLTAASGILSINANRGTTPGAFIKAPSVKLKAGDIGLHMTGSYGGVISVGAISAGTVDVSLNYSTLFSLTSPEKIVTGNLTGKHISVFATGPKSTIDINGSINAHNGSGMASVSIVSNNNGGTGVIDVNGNITVSGKNGGNIGSFDLPKAATLIIENSGSGNGARSVKVNGAVNVTAVGANYHRSSGNESGPKMGQTGTGGVASALIVANGSHGAVSVGGDLTATGPDVFTVVQAHSVSMQNITLTATGHTLTRTLTLPSSAGQSFHSHNNAGQAVLALGNVHASTGSGATATIKAGNITVSGKGVAEADLFGVQVSAGNIDVTATTAKGSIQEHGNVFACLRTSCFNQNSSGLWRGINDVQLRNGGISAGRASIAIGSQQGSGSGVPAASIKTGALSVTGVGEANIRLSGKNVQTQGLTAIATKGTEHGVGSSASGANNSHAYVHTFKLNGGVADVTIRSGNSGSHSSGALLTQNGGPITVTGDITATGPTANVDLKGQSVKVTGNVTLTGSGGALTTDTVFTSPSSPGYHVHYVGAGQTTGLNVQGGINGLVSIGGNVVVKAPGLVGVIVIGTTVKLHGFSASASAAETYSILDTRSNTNTTFTGDSLAVIVDDVAGTKTAPAFTAATVTGNVDLGAKGDVHLATNIDVSGSLVVHAGGNVIGSAGNIISRFNLVGDVQPHANSHSGSGGPSNSAAAFLPAFNAQANAIGITAGGNIVLSKSQLTIGTGSVSTKVLASDTGDPTLLAGLGGAGLAPASAAPNGFFKAGGSLELGSVNMNGSYLYLQAADISVIGKVAMPTGTLVQIAPSAVTGSIDAEGTGAAGATLNLNDNGLFNVFPDGITLVLGATGQSGAVILGNNGPFNIGSDNLIVDTTGTITGLGNVISTGQVVSLSSLLNGVPPVTAGEIDPTSNTTGPGNDKNKQGPGEDLGGGTGNQPSIGQDTNPSSVCH